MKSILSPYFASICSAMSVTGPHTRDWQSCGVENSSATGFLPTSSAKSAVCMSLGGPRVSIFETSPFALASVSVWTFGAIWPTRGIGSAEALATSIVVPAPASLPSLPLVAESTAYLPRPVYGPPAQLAVLPRGARGRAAPAGPGDRPRGALARPDRVGRRGGLLGAVALLGQQDVGGCDKRALGRRAGGLGHVERRLPVDRLPVL